MTVAEKKLEVRVGRKRKSEDDKAKLRRVDMVMLEELVEAIDQAAEEVGVSRSDFIRIACKEKMGRMRQQEGESWRHSE